MMKCDKALIIQEVYGFLDVIACDGVIPSIVTKTVTEP